MGNNGNILLWQTAILQLYVLKGYTQRFLMSPRLTFDPVIPAAAQEA